MKTLAVPCRSVVLWSVALLFTAAATAAPPEAPADLKVDGPVIATVHAKGFQIYVCEADTAGKLSWKLKEPSATFSGDGIEGTHSAGPTWKCSTDGSTVKGKKLREHPSPAPAKDVPLLLLQATDHDGAGKLAEVTFIQRLNTTGGVAPAIGDAKSGDTVKVPYTADYVFYGRGATTRPGGPAKSSARN
jgi:hypothetical protein